MCSYIGVGDEVSTTALVHKALAQGKRIAVPYVHHHHLRLYFLRNIKDLEPALFDLLETL